MYTLVQSGPEHDGDGYGFVLLTSQETALLEIRCPPTEEVPTCTLATVYNAPGGGILSFCQSIMCIGERDRERGSVPGMPNTPRHTKQQSRLQHAITTRC